MDVRAARAVRWCAVMAPELADVVRAAAAAEVVWDDYRNCGTCLAVTGEPCVALSGRIAGGRPDGQRVPLPRAHAARRPRRRR